MDAFVQNLIWGLGGVFQSLINWILGAIINAFLYS